MPAGLGEDVELTSILEAADEPSLLSALDHWVLQGPPLSKTALDIAAELNTPRRRIAFWQHVAGLPIHGRNRLLYEIVASSHREEREGLRLLFTFLSGRPTSFLFPDRIASLRHTLKMSRTFLFQEAPTRMRETIWLLDLQENLSKVHSPGQLAALLSELGRRLSVILCLEDNVPYPFEPIVERLIRLEGEAAALRAHRLVDAAGGYDPSDLAKILPIVVALDEWQGDLIALAERGPAALKHPLEQALGGEETQRWREGLDAETNIAARIISAWIDWMSETELVGSEPAAWVSLLRTLDERRYRKTIYAALILPRRWQARRLGVKRQPPVDLFPPRAVSSSDGFYWIDLSRVLWSRWVGADGLPACPDVWSKEESPLLLLKSRMLDDDFCETVLDNEQWISRQGVVESIARGSRSLKILLRIAGDRKLYTGAANRGVPLALMENPTNVPISALRPFFSFRYVNRLDLLRLSRGGADIREDVRREARAFMRE